MSATESEAEIVERLRGERDRAKSVREAAGPAPVAVAVTGGRDYTPTREEMARFWEFFEQLGASVLRHGDAPGVDRYVAAQMRQRRPDVVVVAHPADWNRWGKAAGPHRNREMMEKSAALIAFPGGRGTLSCERETRGLGKPIYRAWEVPVPQPVVRHEHAVSDWWWSSQRAVWWGRCRECCQEVVADHAVAAQLERAIPS